MTLTRIRLQRFTAFKKLELEFSPGVNILVGENGTGKTHLMKVCYAACDVSNTGASFADKLINVFLPSGRVIGRLVTPQQGGARCQVEIHTEGGKLVAKFTSRTKVAGSAEMSGVTYWVNHPIKSVFIPVKEMLANAPGFRSLYGQREIHFEAVYDDILERAYLPLPRGRIEAHRQHLFPDLERAIEGRVTVENEEFFLRSSQGRNTEFSLLAEGIRKLGLLWILIRNGALPEGSVLFWDEPETNLNPKLFRVVVNVLLGLQRDGVQIFLTTHDYVILKEFDLQRKNEDEVVFHSLYKERETGEIVCKSTDSFLDIDPNAIADTFDDLYDREVKRSLGDIDQ
ncbi:MAG: AAA family ATPase [Candidatus Poribacteria bacterium]|nr:AAA family ATPase [Candidatus Poribacteria bacterium]